MCVDGFEAIEETLTLPDVDDRHVLAAEIKTRAQVIVTNNTGDFPAGVLAQWGIVTRTADEFVVELIDAYRDGVVAAVQQIADAHVYPPTTFSGVLDRLEVDGLNRAVALLRG